MDRERLVAVLASPRARAAMVTILRHRAQRLKGRAQADTLALADLYAHAETPYPERPESWTDMVPFNWKARVAALVSPGSAGRMCAEG